jgi:hypothetical protein
MKKWRSEDEKFTKCVHKFYSKQVSKILLKFHDEVFQGMGGCIEHILTEVSISV